MNSILQAHKQLLVTCYGSPLFVFIFSAVDCIAVLSKNCRFIDLFSFRKPSSPDGINSNDNNNNQLTAVYPGQPR